MEVGWCGRVGRGKGCGGVSRGAGNRFEVVPVVDGVGGGASGRGPWETVPVVGGYGRLPRQKRRREITVAVRKAAALTEDSARSVVPRPSSAPASSDAVLLATVPSVLSAFIVEVLISMAAATVLGTEEAGLKMPELS